jgi:DNA-binding MarR family transcriptional regulator
LAVIRREHDGRAQIVVLTEKGRRAFDDAMGLEALG